MKRDHTDTCHASDMTGYPAPCNCGADAYNDSIEQIDSTIDRAFLYMPRTREGIELFNDLQKMAEQAKAGIK